MAPSREKTCELKLVLDRWGHGNMSYDPKGLRQELILSGGAVDNFLGEPESDFWGKRAELYIYLRQRMTNLRKFAPNTM